MPTTRFHPHHDHAPADAASIHAAVRDLYERYPYPGPGAALRDAAAHGSLEAARISSYRTCWPYRDYREDLSLLIVGCGTVQAARHALRWPRARVVGIDISEASLAQAEALKRQHKLDNLELRRLAIEDAHRLDEAFDWIVCTGVLHHLPDPNDGMRALRSALAPGGVAHIMLYAPYGRIGVYMLQDYFPRLGIDASPEEIIKVSGTLSSLPAAHPIWPLLSRSPDFHNNAGLADSLLHPQDRPYDVLQMMQLLERNGLRFGRWQRQAPYLPRCGASSRTPYLARLSALEPGAQYAMMELFRGSMVRHTALAYRDDEPVGYQAIDFDGASWLDYRPIRLPESVCVEERLPRGASGVLINRAHTDTDLLLPIGREERDVLSRIDGHRSAREAMRGYEGTVDARDYFERLWMHDHIVFDASSPAPIRDSS